jgi:hypothetical protein
VPHQEANFDAAKMETFRRKNQKYTSIEQKARRPVRGSLVLGRTAQ